MTSMDLGGGPSLDQRRDFSGLKDGTQVPGYRGYCPQIKYRVGKTYGNDTFDLAKSYPHRHTSAPIGPALSKPPIYNELPESTGDNKYTKNMVPGYTGYVPRWPFKFGDTYKVESDYCIDEHLTNLKGYIGKANELRHATRSFPTLQSIRRDPQVKNHMNTYRDSHPSRPLLMEDRKSLTEPPMPGYQGFVPRIYTTELGLGSRYHDMTRKGLEAFEAETRHHLATMSAPITVNRSPAGAAFSPNYGDGPMARRLYKQDGMIPKYTGYVPQRRYNFGNTYGDTTRSMEVCYHDRNSFGDYVRSQNITNNSMAY